MATSRQLKLARIYEEKHGVLGAVAARYVTAGRSVEFNHPTRHGPVHLLVRGCGETLVVEVHAGSSRVTSDVVQRLVEKAKLLRGRPVLVLYSKSAEPSPEALELCRVHGVKVKRVRPRS